jgi:hypothetical protein
MLSDQEINSLEKILFGAHRNEVPLLVGKWLPVLFVELRLARSALEAKAFEFFGDVPDDPTDLSSNDPGADQAGDYQGLPVGHEHAQGPTEVEPVAEEPHPQPASSGGGGEVKGKGRGKRSRPRRNRKAQGPYEGLVVAGGDGEPVGGEEVEQVRGRGESPVSNPEAMTNRSCNRCGLVRGGTGMCPACGCPEFSLTQCLEGQLPLPEGGA